MCIAQNRVLKLIFFLFRCSEPSDFQILVSQPNIVPLLTIHINYLAFIDPNVINKSKLTFMTVLVGLGSQMSTFRAAAQARLNWNSDFHHWNSHRKPLLEYILCIRGRSHSAYHKTALSECPPLTKPCSSSDTTFLHGGNEEAPQCLCDLHVSPCTERIETHPAIPGRSLNSSVI